jgi:hypothetical protein
MSDSMLQFLEEYDNGNVPQNQVPTTLVEPVEGTTVDTDSMLNALEAADKTDLEVEQGEVVQARAVSENDIMIPRAYDPDEEIVEPTYEYKEDRRYADVSEEISDLDMYLEGLSEEEREEFDNEVRTSIRSGTDMRKGGPIEYALSLLPTNALLWLGNTMTKAGAMTVDGLESSFAGLNDLSPKAFDILDSAITGGRYGNTGNPKDLANFVADGFGSAAEFAETIPALGNIQSAINTAVNVGMRSPGKALARNARKVEEAQRNNPGGARIATMQAARDARTNAQRVAQENRDIGDALILEFEAKTGKTISKQDGANLTIDPEAARVAGKETAQEITERDGALFDLALGDDVITSPLLDPDKFNGIVSVASELKKKFPESFDNDKTVIDNLLELTVNKDLRLDGQELIDTLDSYGLSFEDYVLTVVGSGSEAGRILNKLSQIKRVKPTSVADADAVKADSNNAGVIRKTIMRVENVRRGGLVSQIATASRNLTSAGIRTPMEALGNVMDNSIYAAQNKGVVSGASELFSGKNWKDSFAGMKYVFSRPDVAEGYTDLILESPELGKQFDRMFNNINEIQKLTGRGTGTKVDTVLSELEDAVDTLNTPNRWQEYLVRRGVFFGEMERLVSREYGIDLIDTLNEGKLQKLLNDSSDVRPANTKSFIALVDEATNKALDVTYAKQPDIPVFRSTSQFITRNGLTVVVPFPRFMFNSMELMGQYAGGASIPLTRKISSVVTRGKIGAGELTAKDRQRITRNIQGIAAVGAAYMYRTSEGALADYEQVPVGDEAQMDTTATYPLAQFLYAGEATKRLIDGTFDDWFDAQEFVELFTGSNFRTGVGNSVLEEMAQLADATDLTTGETTGRMLGRPLGNYLSTWAVPFGQIIDAQRAAGVRGTEFKEAAVSPELSFGSAFTSSVVTPFRQRGFMSPQEEAALPSKEYVGYYDGRERMYPGAKVLGMSLTSLPSEDVDYLKQMGLNWRDLDSKSKIPKIKNYENKMLNQKFLPLIVDVAQSREDKLKAEYAESSDIVRREFTEREYVSNKLRPLVTSKIKKFKTMLKDGSVAQGTPYERAMTKYRRMQPQFRKLATTDFVDRYGETPDPLDEKDLLRLIAIGDAYRSNYSK